MRRGQISSLLQEALLDLPEVGMQRRVEPIEILVQPQRVEYLATLDDSLTGRRSEATALIAQQREEADGRAAQTKRDVEIGGNIQWRRLFFS